MPLSASLSNTMSSRIVFRTSDTQGGGVSLDKCTSNNMSCPCQLHCQIPRQAGLSLGTMTDKEGHGYLWMNTGVMLCLFEKVIRNCNTYSILIKYITAEEFNMTFSINKNILHSDYFCSNH